MPDFMSMRLSSPPVFNASAGAALAAAAEALTTALRQYQKTADLSKVWTGSASQSHTDRMAKMADAATRVIQAITQAKTITATGGAQLTALKTQNDAITASALAGQFIVQPTGQVIPGPSHYAAASGPHHAALMRLFWTIANLYSGQINGTVAATTTTDAQLAATIATVAVQFFSDLLSDKDKAPGAGTVTLPSGLPDSGLPSTVTPMPDLTSPSLLDPPGGTQLAGVSDLGGFGPLGPGGIGALGPGGLTGGPGGLGGVGPGGIGAGGLLAGGSGVIGAGAAGSMGAGGAGGSAAAGAGATAAARGGAGGMMPMMPMGGHGGGSQDQRSSGETWLHEDSDPFDPGDAAPGSVLS